MNIPKLPVLVLALCLIIPMLSPVRAAENEPAHTQTSPTQQTTPQEQTTPTQATSATEETAPAETQPEPVTVVFVCQPEQLTLTVLTDPKKVSSQVAPDSTDPFVYRLMPGTYFYRAEAPGFLPITGQRFTVEPDSAPVVLRLTLDAQPEKASHYTVSFDPCGGETAVSNALVSPGGTLDALPMPTREGYRFMGWFRKETFSEPFPLETPIEQDLTVYAHWFRSSNDGQKITFDPCGGTLERPLATIAPVTANTQIPEEGLAVFDWSGVRISAGKDVMQVAVDAQGRVASVGTDLTVPEGGLVLAARRRNDPTESMAFLDSIGTGNFVFFDRTARLICTYGSSDGLLAHQKYVQAGSALGTLPRPVHDDQAFAGWYTHPQGGSPVTEETVLSVDAPMQLYARWGNVCQHAFVSEYQHPTQEGPSYMRYTCSKCDTVKTVYLDSHWSDWTEDAPKDVSADLIQTATQYRVRLREITTSSSGSAPGWTKLDSSQSWSDYGPWGDWSLEPVERSCPVQIDTTPLYRYYCFRCKKCGTRSPYPGACSCQAALHWQELWSPIAYADASAAALSHAPSRMTTSALGDSQPWFFAAGNIDDTSLGTEETGSDAVVIRLGFRTRTRSRITQHRLWRWGSWGAWSFEPAVSSENVSVETRTVYRVYTGDLPNTTEDHCPTCDEQT